MKQEKYKTKGNKSKKFVGGGLMNAYLTNRDKFDTTKKSNIPINQLSNNSDKLPMYADNIGNAALSLFTPKVPKPTMAPKTRFKTDYNANPELDAIKSGERNNVNFINSSVADGNVAAALASKIGNQATTAKNTVLANKENTETQLYNQGARSDIYTKLNNNRLINDNAQMNMQRGLGIQSTLSENLNNAARDSIHNIDTQRKSKLDQSKLQLELLKDTEGALDRSIMLTDNFDNIILNDYEQLMKSDLPDKVIKAISTKYNQLMQSRNR